MISAYHVALDDTCMLPHPDIIWDVISLTLCLCGPGSMIFPNSASQVAGIIGMSHQYPVKLIIWKPVSFKHCIFFPFWCPIIFIMFWYLNSYYELFLLIIQHPWRHKIYLYFILSKISNVFHCSYYIIL
jgi:hypothetical protein